MAEFRLPGYEVQNALINFQPLNSAIDFYAQQKQQGIENERQNKLMAFRKQEADMAQQRFGIDQERWKREKDRALVMDPLEVERARAGIAQTQAATANIGATGDINEYKYARTNGFTGSFEDWMKKKEESSTKTSLVPIYGTDRDGAAVVMQPRSDGTMAQSRMPDGVTVSRQPIKLDSGTEFILLDPITRQVVGRQPKDVAGAAAAHEVGAAQGRATASLPQVQATAERALQTIQQIRNHPGKDWGLGIAGAVPAIPGTPQAGFVDLVEQAKGQSFLQAFNSLKGGGAITEMEGAKATAAIARLNRARRPEDFEAALADLEDVIRNGVAVARHMARTGGGAPAAAPGGEPPATPGGGAFAPVAPGSYVYDLASGRLVPAGTSDRGRARATIDGIGR